MPWCQGTIQAPTCRRSRSRETQCRNTLSLCRRADLTPPHPAGSWVLCNPSAAARSSTESSHRPSCRRRRIGHTVGRAPRPERHTDPSRESRWFRFPSSRQAWSHREHQRNRDGYTPRQYAQRRTSPARMRRYALAGPSDRNQRSRCRRHTCLAIPRWDLCRSRPEPRCTCYRTKCSLSMSPLVSSHSNSRRCHLLSRLSPSLAVAPGDPVAAGL
mmetsp:Transcript_10003/g.16704  ORF Transcript_10003/g.16704 Transcript_10003/m.16704 type:complete len:215 (-) Transcript_10003:107-751(-)